MKFVVFIAETYVQLVVTDLHATLLAQSVCSRLCLATDCYCWTERTALRLRCVLYCPTPFIATCVDAIGTVFWDRPKEDGTPFTTTNDNGDTLLAGVRETGAPIDFILHSMWSSVDIKLNNNLISESGTNYMYKALLEALLTYDNNTKRIQLANEGFSRDSGAFSQTNSEAPPYNHGLKTHFKWFKEHGVVEFVGPLMSDICNQDRLILPGVDIDIKLWPTLDEFRLITHPQGLKCKLNIEEIYLDVCKVSVSPEVMMGQNVGLEVADSVYPFFKKLIFKHSI